MTRDESDDALAAAAANGDRAALETLLRRHTGLVNAVCRRVLAHPEDALDAAQEALIAIARKIHTFDGRSRFTTWCYRVATNAALDEARRRNRRPTPMEFVPEARVAGQSIDDLVADQLDVDAAMQQLTPDHRAAVALRDLVGLDYAEIGEVLGIPAGTVRSRIARGRAALADHLTDRDDPGNQAARNQAAGNQTGGSEHPTSRAP